jgi:hypothetical protein
MRGGICRELLLLVFFVYLNGGQMIVWSLFLEVGFPFFDLNSSELGRWPNFKLQLLVAGGQAFEDNGGVFFPALAPLA